MNKFNSSQRAGMLLVLMNSQLVLDFLFEFFIHAFLIDERDASIGWNFIWWNRCCYNLIKICIPLAYKSQWCGWFICPSICSVVSFIFTFIMSYKSSSLFLLHSIFSIRLVLMVDDSSSRLCSSYTWIGSISCWSS